MFRAGRTTDPTLAEIEEIDMKRWLGLLASLASVSMMAGSAFAQQQQKPNILVIMADDIGYWNISAYNRGMMAIARPTLTASPTRAQYSPTIMDSNPAPRAAQRSSPDRARCGRGS